MKKFEKRRGWISLNRRKTIERSFCMLEAQIPKIIDYLLRTRNWLVLTCTNKYFRRSNDASDCWVWLLGIFFKGMTIICPPFFFVFFLFWEKGNFRKKNAGLNVLSDWFKNYCGFLFIFYFIKIVSWLVVPNLIFL